MTPEGATHNVDQIRGEESPREMADRLIDFIGRFESTVTGFSAGVDSSGA